MNKVAILLVLIIVAAIVIYVSMPAPQKAVGKTPAKVLECSVNHGINDTNWIFEGQIKYKDPKILIEGALSSGEGAVEVLVLSDGKETFFYGTMTPVSNPSDVEWYDATDLDIPMFRDVMYNLKNGVGMDDVTCTEAAIDDSVFELPEDAVLNPVPAGGLREYY